MPAASLPFFGELIRCKRADRRALRQLRRQYGAERVQLRFDFLEDALWILGPGAAQCFPYRNIWDVSFTRDYIHLRCAGSGKISIQRNAIAFAQRTAFEDFLRSIPKCYRDEYAPEREAAPLFSFTTPCRAAAIRALFRRHALRVYCRDCFWLRAAAGRCGFCGARMGA